MLSALQGVQNGVRQTQRVVEQSGQGIEQVFSKVQSAAAAAAGAFSAKELVRNVLEVRGQFQQLEVAFTTMLGSASEASRLMDQLVKTAATTPFDLKSVSEGAKQLLAYGTQADEVNGTLIRLGDIAAGLSIPLNDLVYLYGTTMTQGRMFTQDLRQFQGRGIPIADELAKIFGVTKDKVGELVTAGKVGAAEVQQAIENMTNAGSRFGGLMEKQSHTITGQISNIEDAIDSMFNDIGKANEGIINTGLGTVSTLVENWQTVGKVVLEVVVAYGSYKAALLAVYAAHKVQAIYGTVTAFLSLAKGVHTAKDAMLLFNLVSKSNPIGLIVSVITSAAAAFYLFSKNTDAAAKAQESLCKIEEEAAGKAAEEKTKIDLLVAAAKNDKLSMDERKEAIRKLNDLIPDYNAQLDVTTGRYIENKAALDRYLQSLARKYELEGAKEKLAEIGRKKANAQLKKDDAERKQKVASTARNVTYNNAGAFIPTPIVGSKEVGDQTKKINEANKELKEALEEEKLILNRYGVDLQKDAVGVSPKPKSTKSEKSIQEQKKELQAELEALSYKEAAGKKGATLRKRIRDLAKKEKVYSASYDTDNAKEAERKAKEAERKAKEAADKAKRAAEEAAKKREYVFESNVTRRNKEEEDAIKAAEAKEEERIASITDAGEKERAAYQLQYDKTIRQVRKEADDLRKAKYDENKRDWDNKNTDKTKVYSDTEEGKKNYKEIKLTTDQESYLQSLISKADKEYTAQRKKWQQEEINTLNEYLKEYGSFEEKKLAITKEYEEKMQNAKSVGEKATLQMQRDKEIEKAKEDNINTSIDWNGIFSDLQGHTKDYLLGLRDQLQDLLSSGNLPIDQMQVVSEKINAIDEELGKQQGIWNFIGEKAREHNRRLKEAADAQERLNVARNQEATEALRLNEVKQEAQKQLSSTGINMSLDEISTSSLNGKIDLTDEKFKSMSLILQKLAVAETKLAEARKNTITTTNKAKQAEDGAKRKSAQAVADWFDNAQEFIEKKGIDQIPDLLGSIGLGKAGDKVSKGLDALNSAAGAAGDFASGNYVGAALKGISAIKSFGSMLGIGGGNEKEVARTTERLTKSNEELGKRIDSLSERIGNSAGNKAINAYETALKAQKEINANSMEILKKQMSYHSAHHSNNSYASDSKIASYNEDAQRAFAAAGVDSANITGLSSIYSLSPEQLKAIRDFAPNLWKYLTEVGKYDKKEYWDAVVEQAGKTEKLTEQIKNNLTQTSFDSLRSSFLDTLMDMNADAEDWSNNFAKMLFKSLVNRSVLNDDFDKWLKDFQNKWAKKLSDGDMSQSDYEAYKSEYSKKMEELKKKTDNLASYMGYSDENAAQKATANGVSSITYEQATNIIALTTAGNISRDQTKELVTSIVSNIASLSSFSSSTSATIVEIRNLMITNNSYLEDILKNSKNIYNVFSSKIDDINRNLKELK